MCGIKLWFQVTVYFWVNLLAGRLVEAHMMHYLNSTVNDIYQREIEAIFRLQMEIKDMDEVNSLLYCSDLMPVERAKLLRAVD